MLAVASRPFRQEFLRPRPRSWAISGHTKFECEHRSSSFLPNTTCTAPARTPILPWAVFTCLTTAAPEASQLCLSWQLGKFGRHIVRNHGSCLSGRSFRQFHLHFSRFCPLLLQWSVSGNELHRCPSGASVMSAWTSPPAAAGFFSGCLLPALFIGLAIQLLFLHLLDRRRCSSSNITRLITPPRRSVT